MDNARLSAWEPLFRQALLILDAAAVAIDHPFPWSFGGGTALMLKYRHRFSKDIDIFVRDPQFLGHLTPRFSVAAESVTDQYEEGDQWVKLRVEGGEIDFIGTGWLTASPYRPEEVLGRAVNVETPAEIIAKKIRYRAHTIKARDLFDLATVVDHDPDAIREIQSMIHEYRPVMLERIDRQRHALEEEFEALDLLDSSKSFEDCVKVLRDVS